MKQSKFIVYRCIGAACEEVETHYSLANAVRKVNELAPKNTGVTYKVMEHIVQEVYRINSIP